MGNKFDPHQDIPDLADRVFVVTGGSAGIGFGICAHLLKHGCEALYVLGRNKEHMDKTQSDLKSWGDISKVHMIQLDLADMRQTSSVAHDLATRLTRLDALILNAGLGVSNRSFSKDGIDMHMQVNHIAQAHLAMVLLPVLQKTKDSRVVLQSSNYHRLISSADFSSLEAINADLGRSACYARSKLAQVLFVAGLVTRKRKGELGFDPDTKAGPWIVATHPGGVRTGFLAQSVESFGLFGRLVVGLVGPFLKDPVEEGCRPALFAATSDEVVQEEMQGCYIVPDKKVGDVSKLAKNKETQDQLWALTDQLVAEKLQIRS